MIEYPFPVEIPSAIPHLHYRREIATVIHAVARFIACSDSIRRLSHAYLQSMDQIPG
jgi:hypothetical protein